MEVVNKEYSIKQKANLSIFIFEEVPLFIRATVVGKPSFARSGVRKKNRSFEMHNK